MREVAIFLRTISFLPATMGHADVEARYEAVCRDKEPRLPPGIPRRMRTALVLLTLFVATSIVGYHDHYGWERPCPPGRHGAALQNADPAAEAARQGKRWDGLVRNKKWNPERPLYRYGHFNVDSLASYDYLMGRHLGEMHWPTKVGDDTEASGLAVFEAGCGAGAILEHLIRQPPDGVRIARVAGVDISERMVAIAQQALPTADASVDISLATGDISTPSSFPDGSFDAAISWSVVNYLAPAALKPTLAEMVRVTRRGGTIMIGAFTPLVIHHLRRC